MDEKSHLQKRIGHTKRIPIGNILFSNWLGKPPTFERINYTDSLVLKGFFGDHDDILG